MNKLKSKEILILVFVMLLLLAGNAMADVERAVDKAIDQASQEVAEQLKDAKFENIETVAVLPFWGEDEDGYILDTVKSYLSNSPYKIMVRSTEEWDK